MSVAARERLPQQREKARGLAALDSSDPDPQLGIFARAFGV